MNKLYILIGCPGSGKSTFAKDHLCDKYVVSRDAIRFEMLKENEPYFIHEKSVYKKYVDQIKEGLMLGDVVADATHLNYGSRMKLLSSLGSLSDIEVIGIVMQTSLKTCLDRNSQRVGRTRVPEDALINMYNSLQIPDGNEGFDRIFIIGEKVV